MNGRKVVITLLLLAILASAGLFAVDLGLFVGAHPTIFATHKDIDSAIQTATNNDQILIIDLSATWCPPCREMDRTTWVDSDVVSWINTNAVAFQIDVDKDSNLARQFDTQFLPTIIAVDPKRNRELDRQVGYVDPANLLNWLYALDSTRKTLAVAPSDPVNESVGADPAAPIPAATIADSDDNSGK